MFHVTRPTHVKNAWSQNFYLTFPQKSTFGRVFRTTNCFALCFLLLPPASAVEVIESVPSVCVSVCPCVSYHSCGWTDWDIGLKFGVGICLDNISDDFIGQGQRSKFKVTKLGNVIVLTYSYFSDTTVSWSMVWCHDVTAWRHDVIWRHSMTSWCPMTSQCDIMMLYDVI